MKGISLKKFAKFALFGSAAAILVGYAATLAWTASGSEQWELEIDRDGVQVYSYKERGSFNKVYKGVVRGKYTQSQIVASLVLENHSLENCKKWIPVCIDLKVIEPYSDKAQGDTILWTLELLPPVFRNREYVIKSQTDQDPVSGVVSIDVMAAANKVPLNECCVRITHIHNRWQISPVKDGEVEIQLIQDFGMSGFFPTVLLNLGNAEETHKLLHAQLPGLVDKELYRTARFPYVNEGGAASAVVDAPTTDPAVDAAIATGTDPAANVVAPASEQ